MITFIYGGSSSGKSAFAEDYAISLNAKNKYYLATMNATDSESKKRIERHRQKRAGKGFVTIEKSCDIANAVADISNADESVVLIECLSNLIANEMFKTDRIVPSTECTDKVIEDVIVLSKKVKHVVMVSNNIFEDGIRYDDCTKEYMRSLGAVNKKIGEIADKSYEVVVGIPIEMV